MGESSRKVSQRKLLCVVSPVSGVSQIDKKQHDTVTFKSG